MTEPREHLILPMLNYELPKRPPKFPGYGKRSDRGTHGDHLTTQAQKIIGLRNKPRLVKYINPKLIFKLKLKSQQNLSDANLESIDLNVVGIDPSKNKILIVFPSDNDLNEFNKKLKSYKGETEGPAYDYFDVIEDLVEISAADRVGKLLLIQPLGEDEVTAMDVELWHTGDRAELRNYIAGLSKVIRELFPDTDFGITDSYIGEYLTLCRVLGDKKLLNLLLDEVAIKEINRKPSPGFETYQTIRVPLSKLPEVPKLGGGETGILVIDSGIQSGHPLFRGLVGDSQVFPNMDSQFATSDSLDAFGHGTAVSGIAVFGDLQSQLKEERFDSPNWLFSAKVTNDLGEYDDRVLLENQLEQAIDYFITNYPNCKVINISLGDARLVYQAGEKQFLFASKIDEIAYRYQNSEILFIVSAGNYTYSPENIEQLKTE
jgi:hypothetical protein